MRGNKQDGAGCGHRTALQISRIRAYRKYPTIASAVSRKRLAVEPYQTVYGRFAIHPSHRTEHEPHPVARSGAPIHRQLPVLGSRNRSAVRTLRKRSRNRRTPARLRTNTRRGRGTMRAAGGAEATRSAYLHDYLRLPLRPLQVTRIGGSGADPAACGTSSSRPAVQTPRRPPSAFHARNIRRRCGADKRICLYICRRFLFPEPNKKPKTDGIQFQRAGIQVAAILERT